MIFIRCKVKKHSEPPSFVTQASLLPTHQPYICEERGPTANPTLRAPEIFRFFALDPRQNLKDRTVDVRAWHHSARRAIIGSVFVAFCAGM